MRLLGWLRGTVRLASRHRRLLYTAVMVVSLAYSLVSGYSEYRTARATVAPRAQSPAPTASGQGEGVVLASSAAWVAYTRLQLPTCCWESINESLHLYRLRPEWRATGVADCVYWYVFRDTRLAALAPAPPTPGCENPVMAVSLEPPADLPSTLNHYFKSVLESKSR